MYRLACCCDEEYENEDIRFIRKAASDTIARGLRHVYGTGEQIPFFFLAVMGNFTSLDFFEGLGQYVSMEDDNEAGWEFIRRKTKRMIEKAEDPAQSYTFDVFEELLFYEAIMQCKNHFHFCKDSSGFYDREEEKKTALKLMENYHYSKSRAQRISRAVTRFHEMALKEEEDDNLFFWDDDYALAFQNGFLEGIRFLKGLAGEMSGYGYDYTCELFTDIGIKAPLLLLGTKEANRIANEEAWKLMEAKLNEMLPP